MDSHIIPTSHILLVEDDQRLAKLTQEYLEKFDFAVSIESQGNEAPQRILNEKPDLVILDISLPGMDGFDICRNVREKYQGIILMLTARDDDMDQLVGLELGADDYIAKPVAPRLLLARIKALIRRMEHRTAKFNNDDEQDIHTLRFGDFQIDSSTREAIFKGEMLELSTSEFDVLWLLASHAGEIMSRDKLLQDLRGIDFDGLDRSIDARISRLRKKLDDSPEHPVRIKTIRGQGYLFSRHDW